MATHWLWLVIDGWKSHAVPSYLHLSVVNDLTARARQEGALGDLEQLEHTVDALSTVYIDEPGLVGGIVGRPVMAFPVDGLTIEMPCHDVGAFLGQLKSAKRRTFKHGDAMGVGMDYFKLHGMHRCIVLTPDARAELIQKMEAQVDEADRLADAHVAAWSARVKN